MIVVFFLLKFYVLVLPPKSSSMTFSVESVPVYLAMILVVPLTFDAIKVVLEDKLDFDVIINRNMLR